MKKIVIILLSLLAPLVLNAQNVEGIRFSKAANWQEVITEAKTANKPIFLDIYATWCVPCKMMDKQVYSNKAVADFVNSNFIAVKVQADTSKADNEFIRGWYKDAAYLKGWAAAYPTFAFFDPNGKYSGREMGFYKPEDFIVILKKAIDPKGSYLAQINAFERGVIGKSQMAQLAIWAKTNSDDSTALTIAKVYKSKYIDKVPLDTLLNPEANEFISRFLDIFSFKDEVIRYMYKHPIDANRKFGKWDKYAGNVVDWIIVKDYIFPFSKPNNIHLKTTPDWKAIEKNVSKHFGKQIAKRLVLDAKIWRANELKNWDDAARYEFEKIDNYGLDTAGPGKSMINNFAYRVVFKNVDDTSLLKKAVSLMRIIVDSENHAVPSHLDTYASVLYKAGKKHQAIEIEKKALNIATQKKDKNNMKFYTEVIQKMNEDLPIWK